MYTDSFLDRFYVRIAKDVQKVKKKIYLTLLIFLRHSKLITGNHQERRKKLDYEKSRFPFSFFHSISFPRKWEG